VNLGGEVALGGEVNLREVDLGEEVKRSKTITHMRGPIPGWCWKLDGQGAFSSGRKKTVGLAGIQGLRKPPVASGPTYGALRLAGGNVASSGGQT
jgi:hypothetical protein